VSPGGSTISSRVQEGRKRGEIRVNWDEHVQKIATIGRLHKNKIINDRLTIKLMLKQAYLYNFGSQANTKAEGRDERESADSSPRDLST